MTPEQRKAAKRLATRLFVLAADADIHELLLGNGALVAVMLSGIAADLLHQADTSHNNGDERGQATASYALMLAIVLALGTGATLVAHTMLPVFRQLTEKLANL